MPNVNDEDGICCAVCGAEQFCVVINRWPESGQVVYEGGGFDIRCKACDEPVEEPARVLTIFPDLARMSWDVLMASREYQSALAYVRREDEEMERLYQEDGVLGQPSVEFTLLKSLLMRIVNPWR